MDRVMVRTALAAYLLFAVPHLLFHVNHHHYATSQAVGETTALIIAVLLPIVLLALTWGSRDTEPVDPAHR
jgi:cytochrome bd-type quinol oxidase subunit 2